VEPSLLPLIYKGEIMRFIGFAGNGCSGISEAMLMVNNYLEKEKKRVMIDDLAYYINGIYDLNKDSDTFILCRVKNNKEAAFLTRNNDDSLIIIANMDYFSSDELRKLLSNEDCNTSEIIKNHSKCPNTSIITGLGDELGHAAIHIIRNKYLVR